jgi:hypothetical protein
MTTSRSSISFSRSFTSFIAPISLCICHCNRHQPLLRYLTTIDFGKLVFERDFDAICKRSGLRVLEKCLVPGSVDNAMQAAFLIVLSRDQ